MTGLLDRAGGLAEGLGYKAPCRVATTANIILLGLFPIDGITPNANDRIMVWQQADQTTNGIYVASLTGWARAIDFSETSAVTRGTQTLVTDGNTWGGQTFELQQSNVTFGATQITFQPSLQSGISAAMAPVVSASTLIAARNAFGITEIIVNDATDQTVNSSFYVNLRVATGPVNYALQQSNTLWNGFGFFIYTLSGTVTLGLNAGDSFHGYSSGATYTTVPGSLVYVTTDGAGNWYVTPSPWLNNHIGVSLPNFSNFGVQPQHNGATLSCGGNSFYQVTFGSTAGYDPQHRTVVRNTDVYPGGDARYIAIAGGTSFYLYPGQSVLVFNDGGAWGVLGQQERWRVSSGLILYAGPTGNDTNSGLSASTAKLTIAGITLALYQEFDCNNIDPIINLANGTYAESIQVAGPIVGASVWFLNGGSPSGVVWRPNGSPSTPYCLLPGDNVVFEFSNIKFDASGFAFNCIGVFCHQTMIADQNSGVEYGSLGTNHIGSDHGGSIFNFNAGYIVSGNANVHASFGPGAQVSHQGAVTVTISGTPSILIWFQGTGSGCDISMGPSVVYSGAPAAGCQKFAMDGNAALQLSGNVLPGTLAGGRTNGGQAY